MVVGRCTCRVSLVVVVVGTCKHRDSSVVVVETHRWEAVMVVICTLVVGVKCTCRVYYVVVMEETCFCRVC